MSEYEDLSKIERRREIIDRLGRRDSPVTKLSKATCNSLHAYLTGSYAISPADLLDGGVSRITIMRRVGDVADVEDLPNELRDDYKKDGLGTILEAMDERGDRREWETGDSYQSAV